MKRLPYSLSYEILQWYPKNSIVNWKFAVSSEPITGLYAACISGNAGIVDKIMCKTIHVKVLTNALYIAVHHGKCKCVKLLISDAEPINNIKLLKFAIKNGFSECVKLLIPFTDIMKEHDLIFELSVIYRQIECVKLLIPIAQHYHCRMTTNMLCVAAQYGYADCVKLLIPVSYPKMWSSQALLYAAEYGNTDCVKLLIPVSEPTVRNSIALRKASANGYHECVKLLIPFSEPLALDSSALRSAIFDGHTECVKLLIPVSNPKARNNKALRDSIKYGHKEITNLLKPVSDPIAIIKIKKSYHEFFHHEFYYKLF